MDRHLEKNPKILLTILRDFKNPDIVLHGIEPEIKEVKKPEKEKFVLEAPTFIKKVNVLATR